MLLPVIEHFAELGWQPFVDPGETYELFTVSGIFKRAHVDTKLADAAHEGVQHLVQRNALFDVCLSSGLAHLIVAYVRTAKSASTHSSGVVGKDYVLKEPIAVQQWVRRRVEALEKITRTDVAGFAHHTSAATPTHGPLKRQHTTSAEALNAHIRELSGLRAVAMALVERLKDGSRQLSASSRLLRLQSSSSDRPEELLKQTELARLTGEGIQHLLELLFRVQSTTMTCQCLQWLKEHHIAFEAEEYQEFYYQARTARASLRQTFEGSYEAVLSSISNSDIAYPSLLIELVMQNANVAHQLSLPAHNMGDLLKLLQSPRILDDIINSYGEDVEKEPVEGYFRVQSALLLYFALDLAYLSLANRRKKHEWTGAELVSKMVDVADSFSAQLGVRDDMKATLLAIWLVENAVNVRLESDDEVAHIYHGAITRLLESSAMYLQKKSGLEADVILYMVESLVHRGESSFAWKIWTAFELDLACLPPVAMEYAVMVNLELSAWERALSLLREQRRLDLLELVFKWLVKSDRMKELVHNATLECKEEELFDLFMMGGRTTGDHVLQEGHIRKADVLVMYYVLRNKFDSAWAVHHEHLALIRESTGGNTQVAHALLGQPSFRIRTALLQNMKVEPVEQPEAYKFKRSTKPSTAANDADIMMIGSAELPMLELPGAPEDERMFEDLPAIAPTPPHSLPPPVSTDSTSEVSSSTPSGPFKYSPGIFSSRSSQPRSSISSKATPVSFEDMSGGVTPAERGNATRAVPIGSIDSSPRPSTRPTAFGQQSLESSAKKIAQALDFGMSPVAPRDGKQRHDSISSVESRPFLTQAVRSGFNSSFSLNSGAPSDASTDDLSLRARSESVDQTPVAVQVGTDMATDSAREPPTSVITATASVSAQDATAFETPKRFHFVREPPQTDSRLGTRGVEFERSPATMELEAMELEAIDEEFSTPSGRGASFRQREPQSAPTRRNPRRQSRTKY